jgi:4-hydroxy-3-polyprenylbenzoate decarboxylase
MLGASNVLRIVVVVDEDIDIYNASDILWAITTRVDPSEDIVKGGGGKVIGMMPMEKVGPAGEFAVRGYTTEGGMGFDATVPFHLKGTFERAHYPADKMDLEKWFSPAQISAVRATQSEYSRSLAEHGR